MIMQSGWSKTKMYEEAMEWLEQKSDKSESEEERLLIEWIMDRIYFDNDMRNS